MKTRVVKVTNENLWWVQLWQHSITGNWARGAQVSTRWLAVACFTDEALALARAAEMSRTTESEAADMLLAPVAVIREFQNGIEFKPVA